VLLQPHSQAWCEDLGSLEVCVQGDLALWLHHLAGDDHSLAEDGGAHGVCVMKQIKAAAAAAAAVHHASAARPLTIMMVVPMGSA
jgi:hypothetical protein